MGERQLPKDSKQKTGMGLIPFGICIFSTLCVIVAGYFHGHMNIGCLLYTSPSPRD